MSDRARIGGLELFAPIRVDWRPELQELDLCGMAMVGTEAQPFHVQLTGEAAIQTLRSFRKLLAHVDEERAANTTRRGLQ